MRAHAPPVRSAARSRVRAAAASCCSIAPSPRRRPCARRSASFSRSTSGSIGAAPASPSRSEDRPMPPRLVVTGASGYIGARLVERARRRGCEVVVLGSPPADSDVTAVPWRLGEVPRLTAFLGATAVLHLAHDWASDRLHGTAPENANLTGTQILADTARGGGLSRFVFASTTSARPEALNAYGKIKYAIEER